MGLNILAYSHQPLCSHRLTKLYSSSSKTPSFPQRRTNSPPNHPAALHIQLTHRRRRSPRPHRRQRQAVVRQQKTAHLSSTQGSRPRNRCQPASHPCTCSGHDASSPHRQHRDAGSGGHTIQATGLVRSRGRTAICRNEPRCPEALLKGRQCVRFGKGRGRLRN
jgi:hypothetical protein